MMALVLQVVIAKASSDTETQGGRGRGRHVRRLLVLTPHKLTTSQRHKLTVLEYSCTELYYTYKVYICTCTVPEHQALPVCVSLVHFLGTYVPTAARLASV